MTRMTNFILSSVLVCNVGVPALGAQAGSPQPIPTQAVAAEVPADYVIGPEDVLGIVFWREAELSGDVTVRPDGRITLPVIGEIAAAGMQPGALQKQIVVLAGKYVNDPNVQVIIRAIHSRRFFVTGRVADPGTFDLKGPMTVMQALAMAGGLTEYADAKNITILRKGDAQTPVLRFNYRDVSKGKKLEQNVILRPGDTVVVP